MDFNENNINNEEREYTSERIYNNAHIPSEPVRSEIKKKEKKHGGIGKFFATIGLGILFGACAAGTMYAVDYVIEEQNEKVVENSPLEKESLKQEIIGELSKEIRRENVYSADENMLIDRYEGDTAVIDVTDVVEKVMPSVVSIKNTYTVKTNFWGSYYETEQEASGSGIIFGENDDELLLATNYHVIQDAEKLEVQFIDGEVVEAHVKGFDSDMDVAVIAVEYKELEPSTKDAIEVAELGDSDALKVGEPAIAIGNALGYGQSVTTGVISALDRKLEISEGVMSEGFIQTDAAINPGNSGGALLNAKGQVIGINSNKIGGSTIEGMGYAIPISKAGPILDELKNKKTMTEVSEKDRGYLGIQGRGVSSEMSEIYGFPEGVYVYEVYPGTGAEAAKLRKGDIITKFDGSTVDSMETLQGYLAYYKAGEVIELTIMRTGADGVYEENKVEVKLVSKSVMPKD